MLVTVPEKLAALRDLMASRKIAAYIIPSGDAHQSEYVTDYWRARAWISGFTGSNGLVVVTDTQAALWTDGRYFIQAEQQLVGSSITLFKMGEEGVPTYQNWLAETLINEATVGFDGRTISVADFTKLKEALTKKSVSFAYEEDLLGLLWEDRPSMPKTPAFEHELCFAGLSRTEKIKTVRESMQKKSAETYLISALDDICWLLNVRGGDIPDTPVVYGYSLITQQEAHWFTDLDKIPDSLKWALANDGVTLHPYEAVFSFVGGLATGCLLYNDNKINVKLSEAVPKTTKVVRDADITTLLKAVKNEVELKNIRNAHIKDGVAMVRFLKWLEEKVGREPLEEADLCEAVAGFRQEQEHFLSPSFATIAAYKENAASMHYSPVKGHSKALSAEGFLLVDSGGQYLDGTTDITRTVVLGPITDEMKRGFTLVLKGHIGLASAVFLSGTTGVQLDVLARSPLWAECLNYRSGTGHGIGYCLGVHEGPHNISTRANDVKLVPGMLCTNEPGLYKENAYGIRTENMLLVREKTRNEDGVFLCFEIISFCPIDLRGIDFERLTAFEKAFLKDYHKKVYETLSPYLSEGEKEWLRKATDDYAVGESKVDSL